MKLTKHTLMELIKEEVTKLFENETPLQRNRRIRKAREAEAQEIRNQRYAKAMGRENTLPYGVSAADHREAEAAKIRKARLQQARDDGRLKEEKEHQPLDAYWSGTNEEGVVTTKDGHRIVVRATTNVDDLKKVAAALEALGVQSIATEDDPVPEVSVLDLLKTMHLGGTVVGGL